MKLLHIHAEDAEEEKCRSLRPCPFGEFSSASYAAVQNKTQSFIDTTLLTAPRVARARTKMTNGSGPFDVAMDVSTINRCVFRKHLISFVPPRERSELGLSRGLT